MHRIAKLALLVPLGLIGCQDLGMTDRTTDRTGPTADRDERGVQAGDDGILGMGRDDQRPAGHDIQTTKGSYEGVIRNIDREEGKIRLETAGETVNLRARPMDLAGMNEGQTANLDWISYDGERWVAPREQVAQTDMQNLPGYTEGGTLTGEIRNIDVKDGTVRLQDRNFHAHPEMLTGLREGQVMTVEFATIDGNHWVMNARPGTQPTTTEQRGVQVGDDDPARRDDAVHRDGTKARDDKIHDDDRY